MTTVSPLFILFICVFLFFLVRGIRYQFLRWREQHLRAMFDIANSRIDVQMGSDDAGGARTATHHGRLAPEVVRSEVVDTLFPKQTISSEEEEEPEVVVAPSAPPMEETAPPIEKKTSTDDASRGGETDETTTTTTATEEAQQVVHTDEYSSRYGTCTICLDPFENGDSIVTGGDCSHKYHRSCIFEWLEKNDDCPNCRKPMWDSDAYDVVRQSIIAQASLLLHADESEV
uniref:RING-type domain-containing protein n=1 Tax=Grammatophora oceanica TaxID=210454 RepID=A0A7S1V410_9STRA|eukprot:CAMPEP_0194032358 /NCGR_PEP_ID=MMETSP0009_2-20130614/5321_1 /TAXON_ID=210454 /ORGANISM="Grammatophora oceanica, Strain CCMP 410" /LENGTH=229 /DNA_ID=CAMNT_0038672775 /DNA_START=95 /DNA_END=784 /DNA_ORIENTATION=-